MVVNRTFVQPAIPSKRNDTPGVKNPVVTVPRVSVPVSLPISRQLPTPQLPPGGAKLQNVAPPSSERQPGAWGSRRYINRGPRMFGRSASYDPRSRAAELDLLAKLKTARIDEAIANANARTKQINDAANANLTYSPLSTHAATPADDTGAPPSDSSFGGILTDPLFLIIAGVGVFLFLKKG